MRKIQAIFSVLTLASFSGIPAFAQHHAIHQPLHATARPLLFDKCNQASEDGASVAVISDPNHFHQAISAVKQSNVGGGDCVGVGVYINAKGFSAGNWSVDVQYVIPQQFGVIQATTVFTDGTTFFQSFQTPATHLTFNAKANGESGKTFDSIYIYSGAAPVSLRFTNPMVDGTGCAINTSTFNTTDIPDFPCDCGEPPPS